MEACHVRRHRRVLCERPAIIEVATPSGAQRFAATVKAMSMGGLGLAFDEWDDCDVKPGDVVLVHLPSGRRSLTLPVQVAWSRRAASLTFDLGVMLLAGRLDETTARRYRTVVAEADRDIAQGTS
jgi:hypothetical protein